mmetsp:Transcript_1535/g.5026  ORF Transcript_1535/g.5026 Transcript_1535/m.5026 type:complete len:202 (-) Transcript_1535:195-800(-)
MNEPRYSATNDHRFQIDENVLYLLHIVIKNDQSSFHGNSSAWFRTSTIRSSVVASPRSTSFSHETSTTQLIISRAPSTAPAMMLLYSRDLSSDGSLTKSVNGFPAMTIVQAVPSAFHPETDAVAFRNSFKPTVATLSAVSRKSTQRVVWVVARYSSTSRLPMFLPNFRSCAFTCCSFSRSATSCRTMPPYSAPSTSEGMPG